MSDGMHDHDGQAHSQMRDGAWDTLLRRISAAIRRRVLRMHASRSRPNLHVDREWLDEHERRSGRHPDGI